MTSSYDELTRDELIQKIHDLEEENMYLSDKLVRNQKSQDPTDPNLIPQFAWAGNLGQWQWDYKTGKVLFNRKKVEILGYDFETFPPYVDKFTELLHPEDYEKTMQNMRDHLTGKTPVYEVEYRIRSKSGEYRWFYDRGVISERNQDGSPKTLVGIVFDINERKSNETKVHTQLEHLHQKLEKIQKKTEIITMCASCKAIQENTNQWKDISSFLRDYLGLQISHGICPACIKELYPDFFSKNQLSKSPLILDS